MNKFEERLAEIRKSEGAIGQWQESIKHKREAFEANLQYDKDCLAVCQGYLNALFEGNVCVRAGDLVEELAKELGVDKNDLQWKIWSDIHFWGKNSRAEMVNLIQDSKKGLTFIVESKTIPTSDFYVSTRQPVSDVSHLRAIQANGKTLIENMEREVRYDDLQGAHYTALEVENKEDFIVKIKLMDFRKSNTALRPMSVVEKAVNNCIEKYLESERKVKEQTTIGVDGIGTVVNVEGKERDRG
ncbi:MAG: hypothetical protein J6J24_05090 [Clostridia bacterium]|nr:hypothetical protein [Clostridia bacterium]